MELQPPHGRLVQVVGLLTIIAGGLVTLLTLGGLLFIPRHQNVAMVVVAHGFAVLGLVGGRKLLRWGNGN